MKRTGRGNKEIKHGCLAAAKPSKLYRSLHARYGCPYMLSGSIWSLWCHILLIPYDLDPVHTLLRIPSLHYQDLAPQTMYRKLL